MAPKNAGRKQKRPQRDALGRWTKGSTGNPNGRPRKWSRIENGSLEPFINSVIEVQTADGPKMMTRDGILLNRLFQSALQGNVHAQIYLDKKFEKFADNRANLHATLMDYYAFKMENPDYEFTAHQRNLMTGAEERLFGVRDFYKIENPPLAPRKRSWRKRSK